MSDKIDKLFSVLTSATFSVLISSLFLSASFGPIQF